MKMKFLTTAMLAALGAAGTAHAVHVNPDGTGQVLLYPYYTVQNGYETYVHIVNTTGSTKAVKVRILEGMNSQEVLDFNLYLSPHDEWAAKIFSTAAGAAIRTSDTSCTSGQVTSAGIDFRNFQYQTDAIKGTDRTREGYIEVIEMGEVTNAAMIANITHTGAVGSRAPKDCAAVRTAANNGTMDAMVAAPTGGLYGFASTIAVGSGLRTSYDAVALDNFWNAIDGGQHTAPGSLLPSLEQVGTTAVLAGGVTWDEDGSRNQSVDPVSAVLMRSAIMNDYVVDSGRNSSTNWIVTFPTKRFYVNGIASSQALSPFAAQWSGTKTQSCDPIRAGYFDREESSVTVTEDDFSPQPEGPAGLTLCHEVNTVSIKRNDQDTSASLYGAKFTHNAVHLASGYEYGWMRIAFTGDIDDDGVANDGVRLGGRAGILTGDAVDLYGLPVIGYTAFSSENTLGGVLQNYMGSTVHKAETPIMD